MLEEDDSSNRKRRILSATFTAKFAFGFCLKSGNNFLLEVSLKSHQAELRHQAEKQN